MKSVSKIYSTSLFIRHQQLSKTMAKGKDTMWRKYKKKYIYDETSHCIPYATVWFIQQILKENFNLKIQCYTGLCEVWIFFCQFIQE